MFFFQPHALSADSDCNIFIQFKSSSIIVLWDGSRSARENNTHIQCV